MQAGPVLVVKVSLFKIKNPDLEAGITNAVGFGPAHAGCYVFWVIRHYFPAYCCLIKNIVARISYFAAYIYGGGFQKGITAVLQ